MPITEQTPFGAALTPEQWSNFVLDHLSAQSVLIASGVTVVRTTNRLVHIPRTIADGNAAWYSELQEIGPGGPTGDELQLVPRKVAALETLSDEAVNDSSPSALDAVGTAMMRSVSLAADRAYFSGTGPANNQPSGILTLDLPASPGAVDYSGLVSAAGVIRGKGGQPNVAYVNPSDLTALQLAVDGMNRPLIQPDATQGMAETIAGLRVWSTPAIPAGKALVAEAAQIIVCLRQDATVAVSTDAAFAQDGTLVRVIARTDVGVNDPNGLALIGGAAPGTQSSKSSKSSKSSDK